MIGGRGSITGERGVVLDSSSSSTIEGNGIG